MDKETIFIDEFGYIVPKERSKYEVTLTGSYRFSHFIGEYIYEIKTITPDIPMTTITSKDLLF